MAIVNKMLEEENIDVSSRAYCQAIIDCIEARKDIFNVILSRDIPIISEYSRSI